MKSGPKLIKPGPSTFDQDDEKRTPARLCFLKLYPSARGSFFLSYLSHAVLHAVPTTPRLSLLAQHAVIGRSGPRWLGRAAAPIGMYPALLTCRERARAGGASGARRDRADMTSGAMCVCDACEPKHIGCSHILRLRGRPSRPSLPPCIAGLSLWTISSLSLQ